MATVAVAMILPLPFLEALISAEQKLYISYIGRSFQDNSERFPSVLVQEPNPLHRAGAIMTGR
ncbi:hypothetical protein ACNKHU_17120 [Shigella flexneri]